MDKNISFFWTNYSIENGSFMDWELPGMGLRARRLEDEWQLARPDIDEEGEWKRFVCGRDYDEIRFTPATPDRPVVVNPENEVNILPGHSARFFLILPAWIQVDLYRGGRRSPIMDFPVNEPSGTWFGSPQDGTLSYSITTHAHRRGESYEPPPVSSLEIITPLTVKNRSEDLLLLRDLNIHCEFLRVYRGSTANWTNEVQISFFGGRQPSKVQYIEKAPAHEPMEKEHNGPRIKQRQDILSLSYSFLKNFAS